MLRYLPAFLCLLWFTEVSGQSLTINEVMSSNGATVSDEDGDFADWIELFNGSAVAVDLSGFGLSDDQADPFRWSFPDTTLPPSSHLLVWASGKDRSASTLHASFALDRSGEAVYLTDGDGLRVDSVAFPEMSRDVSYGRLPDGSVTWTHFAAPTPGLENGGDVYDAILSAPSFSHVAGFFTEAFDLELSSSDPGAVIYYTLDGSEPDEGALRYDGPIRLASRAGDPNELSTISTTSHSYSVWAPPMGEVFKANVVRAAAFREGAKSSEVATGTYFVDPDIGERYTLPIVSLTTDSSHLFDYDRGIYVLGRLYDEWRSANPTAREGGGTPANYHERGRGWERPVHLELFGTDGRRLLGQNAGMRIHGGFSRAFRQKSLRLYARADYGKPYFEHPIFAEKPDVRRYKRLILRNGGQDWTKVYFRDGFMQRLVRHLNVDYQAYEPTLVFINGEYWGIHNLRERIDAHYAGENYSVDPEAVDLLEMDGRVVEGQSEHYEALLGFISANDVRDEEVYAHVKTQMDVDNFIDYQIAHIFVRNNDWPHNNIDFWRHRLTGFDPEAGPGRDGRWRWILFDTDFGFGWSAAPWDHDTVAWAMSPDGNGRPWSTFLLRTLLRNDDFRHRFLSRFADQLNTALRTDRVIEMIDSFEQTLEPEVAEHIHRWGYHEGGSPYHQTPEHLGDWRDNVEVLRAFARQRNDAVWKHLVHNFQLPGTARLTVDVSDLRAGYVEVNRLELRRGTVGVDAGPSVYPWRGRYFQSVPVELVARPLPGYRFVGWEGAASDDGDAISLVLTGDATVNAVFEADEAWLADAVPAPHPLRDGAFSFESWRRDLEPGVFPDHMAFFYMNERDPDLDAMPVAPTTGAYDLASRTRIEGLDDGGIAFLNTSNEEGNPGYPGTKLGAAVVALDTRERSGITVSWSGGTVLPGSRVYNLRLQYRTDDESPLADVVGSDGEPVEYGRNEQAGHTARIGPVTLPPDLEGRPYVQLWWRYYHTGARLDEETGTRDMLRLDDIHITSSKQVSGDRQPELPLETAMLGNYPNPFSGSTSIRYSLAERGKAKLSIYNILGQRVVLLEDGIRQAGTHEVSWEVGDLASGVYVALLEHEGGASSRQMIVIR
ncbi:MAG: CotH kinase family protein [Bacteroidota bacterium]